MNIRLAPIALCTLLTAACPPYSCPEALVRLTQRLNDVCDLDCMTVACGFDFVAPHVSPCLEECGKHCQTSRLENEICDTGMRYAECNSRDCAWDYGDCGYCAQGCKF